MDETTVLCRRLEELADLSDELVKVMTEGHTPRIREVLDVWRRSLSKLGDANIASRGANAPVPDADMLARMKEYTQRVHRADARVKEWLTRPTPNEEELLATKEGIAEICDLLIPTSWDRERDVLMFMGGQAAGILQELEARSYKRLLLYLMEDEPEPDVSDAVVVCRSLPEVRTALETFPGALPRVALTKHMGPFPEELAQEVADTVREHIEALYTRRNTVDTHGFAWIQQGINNLPAIASWPSVQALKQGAFKGIPCIIAAPGPSLMKNVHLLREAKGRAVILSLNRTLKGLNQAGVVPDLVMIVDPTDLRYHFTGVPIEPIGALVLGATVHPELYKLPARRIITYSGNSGVERWVYDGVGESPQILSAGSVATSAVSLAVMWGMNPVILVGQDLAFTGDQYYASTVHDGATRVRTRADGQTFVMEGFSDDLKKLPLYRTGQSDEQRLLEVRGYYGDMVRTSFALRMFHRWFEAAAEGHANTRFLNCTEGGVYIQGMEHISLREVLDRDLTTPVNVEERLDQVMACTDRRKRRQMMAAHVTTMMAAFDECAGLARRCTKLAEKALRQADALAKLDHTEKQLTAALRPILFISFMWQKELRRVQEVGRDAKTLKHSLEASRHFYRLIEQAAGQVRPELDKSLVALKVEAD